MTALMTQVTYHWPALARGARGEASHATSRVRRLRTHATGRPQATDVDAAACAVLLVSGILEQLCSDVNAAPDGLPLLQFRWRCGRTVEKRSWQGRVREA